MKKILLYTAILFSLTGCINTTVTSVNNPTYKEHKIYKIAIDTPTESLITSQKIAESFKYSFSKKNIEAIPMNTIFPPTRKYTIEEMRKFFIDNNFDSYLSLEVKASQRSSQTVGYNANTTTQIYGNSTYSSITYGGATQGSGSYNATTYGTTTTTPIVAHNQDTKARITLHDVNTGAVIWFADTYTQAGGALYMGDTITIDDIVLKTINKLVEDGHIDIPIEQAYVSSADNNQSGDFRDSINSFVDSIF